jgi:hypothetical protein
MSFIKDITSSVTFLMEKWSGVDDTVVAKFAQAAGRPPAPGTFDGMGDLGLLMFLLAGLAGGFALGYFYRGLFGEKAGRDKAGGDVV